MLLALLEFRDKDLYVGLYGRRSDNYVHISNVIALTQEKPQVDNNLIRHTMAPN